MLRKQSDAEDGTRRIAHDSIGLFAETPHHAGAAGASDDQQIGMHLTGGGRHYFVRFTGFHPDYHKVTDTVEKINFEKMVKILKLAYASGFEFADSPNVPKLVGKAIAKP